MNDETNTTEQEPLKPEDIRKEIFQPAALEAAGERLAEVVACCQENNLPVHYNFNPEESFPDGYALAVIPISQRAADGSGNKLVSVAIAAIPTLETVSEHAQGTDALRDTLASVCVAAVANALRPKKSGTDAASVPFTVEDFLLSRIALSREFFREVADAYVKSLREKGVRKLTVSNLERALESASWAEATYSKVKPAVWSTLIDLMIARAEREGKNPGILRHWQATRDAATIDSGAEVDVDDLTDF